MTSATRDDFPIRRCEKRRTLIPFLRSLTISADSLSLSTKSFPVTRLPNLKGLSMSNMLLATVGARYIAWRYLQPTAPVIQNCITHFSIIHFCPRVWQTPSETG